MKLFSSELLIQQQWGRGEGERSSDLFGEALLGGEERTWELLTKAEVETRLGYPVTKNGTTAT